MKQLNLIQKHFVWARGKTWWWWRVPVLVAFVIMLVQNWHDPMFALARLNNPFSALDLGIHELGHIIFSPFGDFIRIAGGSLFQCIFPLLWMIGFWQVRYYFAASMCWCWLGMNLFDVATYAADARSRQIPLSVGLGGISEQGSDEAYDQAHDWYQLLSRTHHLSWDYVIARDLRIAATVAFFIGFSIGALLIMRMFASSVRRGSGEDAAR